jgi:aryl-alcohol dehydrogenase-like predicted oxidoreductase
MEHRTLGKSGIGVSVIGFGAWGIGGGWGETADVESTAALNLAIDRGVTFIDTAYGYGGGHSERLIGDLLRSRSEDIVVATKVPPVNKRWPAAAGTPVDEGYTAAHIRECTEESLRRLGRDYVDVQQFHVWAPNWLGQGDWLDEIGRLKDEGKIRAFGISVNDHEPATAVELVRSGLVDTIQVIYNIFDQSPQDELLPAAQEHGVGVIVRVALDEGGLTGTIRPDTTFADDDWRHRYFRDDRPAQVADHVDAILRDLELDASQLPETALRFVLSNPAVSTVIAGMRRTANVERNVLVGDAGPLSSEQLEKLRGHRWERNFYQ